MSDCDDLPIPFPSVAQPPSTIADLVGDLQVLHGLVFNGLLPHEVDGKNAMVLCFGAALGEIVGFGVGVVMKDGSAIDLGDDVTDAASYEAAMSSLHGTAVESVETAFDKVGDSEVEVLQITFASGRRVKIGGPGAMIVMDAPPTDQVA
jgi:hypothetical protein